MPEALPGPVKGEKADRRQGSFGLPPVLRDGGDTRVVATPPELTQPERRCRLAIYRPSVSGGCADMVCVN